MNALKLSLLICGFASIVFGIALRSVPCALVTGGFMSFGLLYLITVAEGGK